MKPAFKSVRGKLFVGVLLTSLVALVISGGSLFLYDLRSYRESSANGLALEAELLGNLSIAALQFGDPAVATQNLGSLKARPSVRTAAIYTPRGAVFAGFTRSGVPTSEIPALPGVDGVAIAGDRISVFRRIVADGEIIGTIYLAQDLGLYKRIGSYGEIALAVMVAALVASAALSEWVQKGITRPIIQISNVAREVVERRNYAVRARRTTRDETGNLVDAVNEMLEEIQRRTSALESSSEEIGRLNKDLERRVAERTAELESSNVQLKSANMAKSSFLSMMSHEIRTPLNGVLGMLELMSLSELSESQRTTLGIVRDSGRSLLRIIDDILDFSKIEAGKLEIVPEPASIRRIVDSVTGIYSGNASSKGLALVSRVDPMLSPAVMVDPLRLQQILNNFVSNAIKFTSKGRVEIAADLLERNDGVEVTRLTVTDTGIGISPEGQAALFQPFAQADGKITRVFGGTGLGLSIGRRLAELMGGTVSIASTPGKGTAVTLVVPLPIADPALLSRQNGVRDAVVAEIPLRRAPPSVEEARLEGTLILIVDDHPINRLMLTRQAHTLGYANESAEDGAQALQMWKSGKYRLVITDCNMPEMDGYELSRRVREVERTSGRKRTTIIACTANALKGEAEKCYGAGMDDYIAKPVDLASLLTKLDQWLPIAAGPPQRACFDAKAAAGTAAQFPESLTLERSVLSEIVGGDPAFEREVIEQFQQANDEDVALVSRALAARDAELLAQGAHRIKGASRYIGATALAEASAALEAGARANDWGAILQSESAFRSEVARLEAYLSTLVETE